MRTVVRVVDHRRKNKGAQLSLSNDENLVKHNLKLVFRIDALLVSLR